MDENGLVENGLAKMVWPKWMDENGWTKMDTLKKHSLICNREFR